MNKTVVVDIDGVLADFEWAFCQEFGNERRELVSLQSRYPNKARKITEFINDGFVYKDLEPIQLGLDICDYLNREGFDVSIVTARPFGFESLTRDWLKRHGVNFTSFVSDTSKTGRIALMKPICAVDDLFSVHKALLLHNIPTIVVAQPWNKYIWEKMLRIRDLPEFIQTFDGVLASYSKKGE
jgi:hypothetical protein